MCDCNFLKCKNIKFLLLSQNLFQIENKQLFFVVILNKKLYLFT